MTTILAIESEGTVQVGFDSQATADDAIELAQPKVFENNGATYGVAGTVKFLNELRYADLPTPGTDPDKWVTQDLIPVIRDLIERVGLEKNDQGEYEIHILAVVTGRVYEIVGDLSWVRNTTGVYAAGSGQQFALGALTAGADIHKALKVAAHHDPYTGGTLRVITVSREQ